INAGGAADQGGGLPVAGAPPARLYTDIAPTARTVLDDELLTEALRQPLTNEARSNVVNTTGRKWDNDAHRPRRIGLCPCNPRHRRQRGSARGQMEKISTGKLHDETLHSALILAARITLAHFSASSAMSLLKSDGEPT